MEDEHGGPDIQALANFGVLLQKHGLLTIFAKPFEEFMNGASDYISLFLLEGQGSNRPFTPQANEGDQLFFPRLPLTVISQGWGLG